MFNTKEDLFFDEILVNCNNLTRYILSKLKIELYDLYNLLKFMRHNDDVCALKLNDENIVNILSQIYQEYDLKGNCNLLYR